LALTDRSVGQGRYRWSVRFHLRDNTVDIDGQFGYTYGKLQSISTVGSVHSTQKLVDINHVGRITQISESTVDIDRRSGHTLKKNSIKKLIFETNRKDVPPTSSAFFLGLGFDTVTLEIWVPLEKAQVFADGCRDLFEKGKATRREISSSRGPAHVVEPRYF